MVPAALSTDKITVFVLKAYFNQCWVQQIRSYLYRLHKYFLNYPLQYCQDLFPQ